MITKNTIFFTNKLLIIFLVTLAQIFCVKKISLNRSDIQNVHSFKQLSQDELQQIIFELEKINLLSPQESEKVIDSIRKI